jgi:hypothetical protein
MIRRALKVFGTMQRYLAQQRKLKEQTEKDRRRALGFELALTRMRNNVCPGCELTDRWPLHRRPLRVLRAWRTTAAAAAARKNAFFRYCPTYGIPTR